MQRVWYREGKNRTEKDVVFRMLSRSPWGLNAGKHSVRASQLGEAPFFRAKEPLCGIPGDERVLH
jgi:hypothetical protein